MAVKNLPQLLHMTTSDDKYVDDAEDDVDTVNCMSSTMVSKWHTFENTTARLRAVRLFQLSHKVK